MLEARKLSAQVKQDQVGKIWSWLSGFIWLLTLAVLGSIWIGLNFQAPPPDKSQEKMASAHAQALSTVAQLTTLLAPEQELTSDMFQQLAGISAPLTEFAQMAATATRISPESADTQTWPGRINALVVDLKVLNEGQASLDDYFTLRNTLIGLYKPKGTLNPKQMADASAARGFYTAAMDWVNVTVLPVALPAANASLTGSSVPLTTVVPKLTWAHMAKGQPIWREINTQLDALEAEAKQSEDPTRAKMAKETLSLLAKNDSMQAIRKADDAWSKMMAAQDRLKTATSQLPSEPQVILPPPPWDWSRLAFPGSSAQGLLLGMGLLMLSLLVNAVAFVVRRNHLRALSERWLTVTRQLESAVRTVDAPLANAVQRIDAMSTEFGPVLEKLKVMQQALNTPIESPAKTMEAQAWNALLRMQTEIESDLNLLREKLLNIHLQFCNGQTHENLVYDLSFTTEAIQTVCGTAKDLGRSVAVLKENLQQVEIPNDDQALVALIAQVNGLRNSAKRISLNLQDLSGRLQISVEDVPKGRRFEADLRDDENGRLNVNQPI